MQLPLQEGGFQCFAAYVLTAREIDFGALAVEIVGNAEVALSLGSYAFRKLPRARRAPLLLPSLHSEVA